MRIIAHRGNLFGPSERENQQDYLQEALDQGYDVEVDLWHRDGKLWSGHNEPTYEMPGWFILSNEKIWAHAKDLSTLQFLLKERCVPTNIFYQTGEPFVLTNTGYIWHHSQHRDFGAQSIAVQLGNERINELDIAGICTDHGNLYADKVKPPERPFDLLILDVDGVLTKGKIYDQEGRAVYKEFLDRDWTAIKRFKAAGVKVCFVSGDLLNNNIAKKRNIDFYYSPAIDGVIDKSLLLPKLIETYGVKPERMAFFGDDYYDLSLLRSVGFSFCPMDSPQIVKGAVSVALSRSGEGCVATLYDLYQNHLGDPYPLDYL